MVTIFPIPWAQNVPFLLVCASTTLSVLQSFLKLSLLKISQDKRKEIHFHSRCKNIVVFSIDLKLREPVVSPVHATCKGKGRARFCPRAVSATQSVYSTFSSQHKWNKIISIIFCEGMRSHLYSLAVLKVQRSQLLCYVYFTNCQNLDDFWRWRGSEYFLCSPFLLCRARIIFQL